MRTPIRVTALVALLGALSLHAAAQDASQPSDEAEAPPASILPKLRDEAQALGPLTKSVLAAEFLAAAANLPEVKPRMIYQDKAARKWYTAAEAAELEPPQREKLQEVEVTDELYYTTKYGSPLAYSRPIDLLGKASPPIPQFAGQRVLDFGYGTIGHLRIMASLGADVVGLDVDPFLTALYSEPADQGPIAGSTTDADGGIRLVSGRFSDPAVKAVVGDGYDLIISKNTLKRGFLHPPPEVKVDKNRLIDLGLDEEAFVRTLFEILNPSGRLMIYNICPRQADLSKGEAYIPWADGRCPFDRTLLEKVGFHVVAFDQDDTGSAKRMAKALGWDKTDPPMDVENDLFAHFTLLEKPAAKDSKPEPASAVAPVP